MRRRSGGRGVDHQRTSTAPVAACTRFATVYPRDGARPIPCTRSSPSSTRPAATRTAGQRPSRTRRSAASVTPDAGKNEAEIPSAPNHVNAICEPAAYPAATRRATGSAETASSRTRARTALARAGPAGCAPSATSVTRRAPAVAPAVSGGISPFASRDTRVGLTAPPAHALAWKHRTANPIHSGLSQVLHRSSATGSIAATASSSPRPAAFERAASSAPRPGIRGRRASGSRRSPRRGRGRHRGVESEDAVEHLDPTAAVDVGVVGREPRHDREHPRLEEIAAEHDPLVRRNTTWSPPVWASPQVSSRTTRPPRSTSAEGPS